MMNALYAELRRLARRRVLLIATASSAGYAIAVTWILIATASPTPSGVISVPALEQADGGTRTVLLAASFSSILVLALFTGMAAGDYSRGTWRVALLQNPGRIRLAAGVFLARLLMMSLLTIVLFVAGWVTAYLVASGEGISTSAWVSGDAWVSAAADLGKVLLFGTGWALLGTALGWVTRSIPVGLAIGVLWAGPIENAIGMEIAFGRRWFPGLLLRDVLAGGSDYTARVGYTLAVYALVVLVATAAVLRRRDVTG